MTTLLNILVLIAIESPAETFTETGFISNIIIQAEFNGKPPRRKAKTGETITKTPFENPGVKHTLHGYPIYIVSGSKHLYTKPKYYGSILLAQFRSYAHNPRWRNVKTLEDALRVWAKKPKNHIKLTRRIYPGALETSLKQLFKSYKPYKGK